MYTQWNITWQKHERNKQSHQGQESCNAQHYKRKRTQEGEVKDSEDDVCESSWTAA